MSVPENRPGPVLDIRNITLSYGEKTVLEDFSLSLERGEKIILAGPNGSGKTTLIRAILGFIRPQKGTIEKARGLKTAYMRQGDTKTICPVSVREVVAMGLYRSHDRDESRIEDAMKMTGVSHLSARSFASLSGGERQRVQIARSITQKAGLILMDEPTTFLDSAFRDELVSILTLLPQEMAAVVVTHDEILSARLGWKNVRIGKEDERCRG